MSFDLKFPFILSLATITTRFLPFVFYSFLSKFLNNRINSYIITLLIGILVCNGYANFEQVNEYGLRLTSGLIVALSYYKTRNVLLSILSGSILYVLVLNTTGWAL